METSEVIAVSAASRRTKYKPQSHLRVLCVCPAYRPSFTNFYHSYCLMPNVKGFMSPQGLLVVAAYLPEEWEVRLVDENVCAASAKDYEWADVVFITGMHVQRGQIESVNRAAHCHGKVTVLGGPSVSSCPEYYPEVDVLHVGELGDATDALFEYLDSKTARPTQQIVFKTSEKLPLDQFPVPAYNLVDLSEYFVASAQFSSGCTFGCDFCDIPALYGNKPRMKTPDQMIAELDAIYASGLRGLVHFVDDNFIGNPRAAIELLTEIINWQRKNGYPLSFACEATLNLAQRTDILELMREAMVTMAFCGIESPDPVTLESVHKRQNLTLPMLDAINTINSYGIEIVAGVILGFDTDTPETVDQVIRLVDESKIPMWTVNILYALPNTPLYHRLSAEDRLTDGTDLQSNIVFKEPYETVVERWQRCVSEIYSPANLLKRFLHQSDYTYRNRLSPPREVRLTDLVLAARMIRRIFWHIGLQSDFRGEFWRTLWPVIRGGRIEDLLHIGVVGHHLIHFARDATETCLYNDPNRGDAGRSTS